MHPVLYPSQECQALFHNARRQTCGRCVPFPSWFRQQSEVDPIYGIDSVIFEIIWRWQSNAIATNYRFNEKCCHFTVATFLFDQVVQILNILIHIFSLKGELGPPASGPKMNPGAVAGSANHLLGSPLAEMAEAVEPCQDRYRQMILYGKGY